MISFNFITCVVILTSTTKISSVYHGVGLVNNIRLVNGGQSWRGRLEVSYNGSWGTVCDDGFGVQEAKAVCNQLGYTNRYREPAAYPAAYFGQGIGPIYLDDVNCPDHNNHAYLNQCTSLVWGTSNCNHSEDVSVDCYVEIYKMRLVNGGQPWRGRLEVTYTDVWGTVCDDNFGAKEAKAVCNQLGYHSEYREPAAYPMARFGQGTGPIYLDQLNCPANNNKVKLYQCPSWQWGTHTCTHSEDVSVDCYVEIYRMRLVDGGFPWRGRLEVTYNEVWGTVCDDNFGAKEAKAVCNQLGYHSDYREPAAYPMARFGEGTGPIYLDQLNCPANDNNVKLYQCPSWLWGKHTCTHSEDISVDCYVEKYSIRLVNGGHPWRGRLEVTYNGVWGTVCDDDFGAKEAKAVCNQLGYHSSYREPAAYPSAHFGQGLGPIYLDEVNCPAYVNNVELYQCPSWLWGTSNCNHDEDVSVDCYYEIFNMRLVNGGHPWRGRLEVTYNGVWGTVCDDYFGAKEAKAVCNQLGYHSSYREPAAYPSAHFGQGKGPVYLGNVNCPGNDSNVNLYQCTVSRPWGSTRCGHNEDVSVDCFYAASTTSYGVQEAYSIRLVDGDEPWSGRLEVYHEGQWGTVCDNGFGAEEATAVCNQIGYFSSNREPTAYQSAYYGQGYGPIWLENVICPKNTTHVKFHQCTSKPWGQISCSHSDDVSVNCQQDDGISTTNVTLNDTTIDDGIPTTDPTVNDTTIGVTQVRLVGGYGYWEGRVEIYKNGEWGTVCPSGFSEDDAYVICKILNVDHQRYPKIHYSSSYYGQGSGRVWTYQTRCHGNESDISQCWYEEDYNCSHSNDIGINCQSPGDGNTSEQTTITNRLLSHDLRQGSDISRHLQRGNVPQGKEQKRLSTSHDIHKREAPGDTARHHDNKPHLLYAGLTVLVVVGVVAITVVVLRHKSRKQNSAIENI